MENHTQKDWTTWQQEARALVDLDSPNAGKPGSGWDS